MPQVSDEIVYRTSSLLESFKVIPLAPQFLRDKSIPTSRGRCNRPSRSRVLSRERRSLHLTALASPKAQPCHVRRRRRAFFSPPHIKPIRNLTSDDLFYKSAAAAANADADRNAELLLLDFQELDAAIGRTEEKDGRRLPVHWQS